MECLVLMFRVCLLLQFAVSQDQTAWSQFVSQGSSYHLHKDRFWSQIRKVPFLSPSTPRRWQSEGLQFQSPRKRRHRKTQTPSDFRLLLWHSVCSAPATHELRCIQFTLIGDWWFQNRSENMPFNIMIQMEGYGSRIVDETHPQIVLNTPPLCLRGHSFHSVSTLFPVCFHSTPLHGFATQDLPKFQAFVGRVASHLGSDVMDPSGLEEYAQKHLLSESSGGDQFQALFSRDGGENLL